MCRLRVEGEEKEMKQKYKIRCDSCNYEREVDAIFVNSFYESMEDTKCDECNSVGKWTVFTDNGTGKLEHVIMASN